MCGEITHIAMLKQPLTREKLTVLLQEAAVAHHEFEEQEQFMGRKVGRWEPWYAQFILRKLAAIPRAPTTDVEPQDTDLCWAAGCRNESGAAHLVHEALAPVIRRALELRDTGILDTTSGNPGGFFTVSEWKALVDMIDSEAARMEHAHFERGLFEEIAKLREHNARLRDENARLTAENAVAAG